MLAAHVPVRLFSAPTVHCLHALTASTSCRGSASAMGCGRSQGRCHWRPLWQPQRSPATCCALGTAQRQPDQATPGMSSWPTLTNPLCHRHVKSKRDTWPALSSAALSEASHMGTHSGIAAHSEGFVIYSDYLYSSLQHGVCSFAIHLSIRQPIRSIMVRATCEHVRAGGEVPVSERHRGE